MDKNPVYGASKVNGAILQQSNTQGKNEVSEVSKPVQV